jgi:iron complex transport system permease protein
MLVAGAVLIVTIIVSTAIGPADLSPATVIGVLLSHLPFVHIHSSVPVMDQAIIWQIRLPRVILAGIVGSMLAVGGASYQGVFRNPLADPYLLGVAAGAGLGATIAIVTPSGFSELLPLAAFVGGVIAVSLTYITGAKAGRSSSGPSIILAGVAVAAIFTAIQTNVQQQHAADLQPVYSWILGSLSVATWSDITLILPYVVVSAAVLLAHRRLLDVLRIGEEEATSLGVNPNRVRLTVVAAATLGTAAAVSVSGLIGFVGIIVPHLVRLTTNASYKVVMPVSLLSGASFLILADLCARMIEAPGEVPLGVVTAFIGGPFFILVLRSRRSNQGVL